MRFNAFRAGFAVSAALAAAAFAAPAAAADAPFTLGIWGDMPYAKAHDLPKIPALIDDMNASDIAFSIYDGDIKDGSSECTDETFVDAEKMFDGLKKPVVYVPGDNEWTDCHRTNNGGHDNLERLATLRRMMFAKTESFGQETMPLEHQGAPGEKFSENTLFTHGGVMFVGLNVPGSNNNKVDDEKSCTKKSARTQAQCDADNAEWAERDAANIAWMTRAFDQAKAGKMPGIMLVLQADVGFDLPETEDTDESRLPDFDGYAKFMDALYDLTAGYDGQVVLVHGDTHYFKIDKPLKNATHMLPNFTRVETFGSPNVHWVRVTVDPSNRNVFTFEPMIVPANAKASLAE